MIATPNICGSNECVASQGSGHERMDFPSEQSDLALCVGYHATSMSMCQSPRQEFTYRSSSCAMIASHTYASSHWQAAKETASCGSSSERLDLLQLHFPQPNRLASLSSSHHTAFFCYVAHITCGDMGVLAPYPACRDARPPTRSPTIVARATAV